MNLIRAVLFTFIALVIAACQPTGIRSLSGATQAAFGNVEPRVPEGWKRYTRPNGVIVYQCALLDCENRGQISFSAMTFSKDAEVKARVLFTSNMIQRDFADMAYKVTNGAFQQVSFVDLSNADGAVYERVVRINLVSATYYNITRHTVQGQYSRIVSASAPTLPKARQYLKIALAAVK